MAHLLILCPTFDHADTLYASIASVRAQHFEDWEMVVIGDGAPQRTYDILEAICAEDPRIRFERHPKSSRNGEDYRDPVIRACDAQAICHLSDDDIWAPDHLDSMLELLDLGEWVTEAPLRVAPGGGQEWWPINHGTDVIRASVCRRVPPSAGINYVAYRRETYLRLPVGWRCAPPDAGPTDIFMWGKFFADPRLYVASTAATSVVKFASKQGARAGRTPEQRMAEIGVWLARMARPGLVDGLRRAGRVEGRFIELFTLHGCGSSPTLGEAFHRAGMEPVAADVPPRPALNDALMPVPLTEAQLSEAERAWRLLRALDPSSDATERERAALVDALAGDLDGAVSRVRQIIRVADPLTAERGLELLGGRLGGGAAVLAQWALSQVRLGNQRLAGRLIDELEAICPGHPQVESLRRRLTGEIEPECGACHDPHALSSRT